MLTYLAGEIQSVVAPGNHIRDSLPAKEANIEESRWKQMPTILSERLDPAVPESPPILCS